MKIDYKPDANKFDRCESIIRAVRSDMSSFNKHKFGALAVMALFFSLVAAMNHLAVQSVMPHALNLQWLAFAYIVMTIIYGWAAFSKPTSKIRLGLKHAEALGYVDAEIMTHAQIKYAYPISILDLRYEHLAKLAQASAELQAQRLKG